MFAAKFLLFLMGFLGAVLGGYSLGHRVLELPQDIGTPMCVHQQTPCTREDYRKGKEQMHKFINTMVNDFVDEDIKAPACLETNDCPRYLEIAYNEAREIRFNEILSEIRRVNRFKF